MSQHARNSLASFPDFRACDQAQQFMAFIRSPVALFAALALTSVLTAHGQTILGGYAQKTPTNEDLKILVQAAGNASNYNEEVSIKICLLAVEGLETQTVAGTNYKFQVAGCMVKSDKELGACDDRKCTYSSYDIVVFSQPWTDTFEVTSITPMD